MILKLNHTDIGPILFDSKDFAWAYYSDKNKATHIVRKSDDKTVLPVKETLEEIYKLLTRKEGLSE